MIRLYYYLLNFAIEIIRNYEQFISVLKNRVFLLVLDKMKPEEKIPVYKDNKIIGEIDKKDMLIDKDGNLSAEFVLSDIDLIELDSLPQIKFRM